MGDPIITFAVKRTKKIHYQIVESAKLGEISDSGEIVDDVMATPDGSDSPNSSIGNNENRTDDRVQQKSFITVSNVKKILFRENIPQLCVPWSHVASLSALTKKTASRQS